MFKLDDKSEKELQGVKSPLVNVVRLAATRCEVKFAVHDGLRTLAEQEEMVSSGASTTLNSKHLTGDAVDLVPIINGKLRWEWEPIYKIAVAMRSAAQELNEKLRWGAAWDVIFNNTLDTPEAVSEAYAARRKAQGKKIFLDGPHFERA